MRVFTHPGARFADGRINRGPESALICGSVDCAQRGRSTRFGLKRESSLAPGPLIGEGRPSTDGLPTGHVRRANPTRKQALQGSRPRIWEANPSGPGRYAFTALIDDEVDNFIDRWARVSGSATRRVKSARGTRGARVARRLPRGRHLEGISETGEKHGELTLEPFALRRRAHKRPWGLPDHMVRATPWIGMVRLTGGFRERGAVRRFAARK